MVFIVFFIAVNNNLHMASGPYLENYISSIFT